MNPRRWTAVTLTASSLVALGCKAKVDIGHGLVDERGPATWVVDGKSISVDRTYFELRGNDVVFDVEWTCTECSPEEPLDQAEAFAVSRPVLWHALESGEAIRLAFTRVGKGQLGTSRLAAVVAYRIGSKIKRTRVEVEKFETLFDFTWSLGDRSYRVFGPGYYFDYAIRKLFFTVKWHDRNLCDELYGITDARAAELAMPVMKQLASRKLYRFVPVVGAPPDAGVISSEMVDAIGVELGCPATTCAGQVDCPVRGYRVARTLAEIAAAP